MAVIVLAMIDHGLSERLSAKLRRRATEFFSAQAMTIVRVLMRVINAQCRLTGIEEDLDDKAKSFTTLLWVWLQTPREAAGEKTCR